MSQEINKNEMYFMTSRLLVTDFVKTDDTSYETLKELLPELTFRRSL
jgi:hypothetical protein